MRSIVRLLLLVLFVGAPALVHAVPGFQLQLEASIGGEPALPMVITLVEGRTATLEITRDDAPGSVLSIDATVTTAAAHRSTGAPQAEVALSIRRAQGGAAPPLLSEPRLTMPIGTLASLDIEDPSGAPSDGALSIRAAVHALGEVDPASFPPCGAEAAGSASKSCGEGCCCVGCQSPPGERLRCCGGRCSACGSSRGAQ